MGINSPDACESSAGSRTPRDGTGRTLQLAGQNPLFYFHSCKRLGALLEAGGRYAEAAGMYKAALSWSGGDKEAMEARSKGTEDKDEKQTDTEAQNPITVDIPGS